MWQNFAAGNYHFVYAFVDVSVVSGNDVFDVSILQADVILYNEIQHTK